MTATRRQNRRATLADLFRRTVDDDPWPPENELAAEWPPPERIGHEDPRDRIPVRWLPISGYRDQVVDSKLAAYLQCAANEDTAWAKWLAKRASPSRRDALHGASDERREAWREYMSALLFGYWPEHEGRPALPAPKVVMPSDASDDGSSRLLVDVPRPAARSEGALDGQAGPGDSVRVLPTVLVGGYHIPLDDEPLPDLPRPGGSQASADVRNTGPGQPDATVSFQVTGETQPFDRYAALRPENLDAAEDEDEDEPEVWP